MSLGRKWAANRQSLWSEFNDPTKTKDEINHKECADRNRLRLMGSVYSLSSYTITMVKN